MQYLTIWDLVLTPVYLIVLSFIARRYRDKKYPLGHPLRKYYLPGLYAKFGGVIFIALVYQYYYGGGDTFNYFTHTKIINSSLANSFNTWVDLLFRVSPDNNPQLYQYASQMEWYKDPSSYTVAVIGAVLGLLNKTTYLPIALLFAYISYSGIWAMYKTFVQIYPDLYKPLAIAFLFIPSTVVWGSAIFKDTICMFGLGWMTYTTFRIFINKDFSVRNLSMLIISFYLIALIKLYILLAFIPALGLWLLMNYSKKIRSSGLRFLANIFFVGIIVVNFLFFAQVFAKELNRYSLEKIAKTAAITRGYIYSVSERDEGSAYDLGEFEPTIGGMLLKFPQAVVVTLYRPYIWESGKIIVLLSAIESLVFLFFTLRVFYKRGWTTFSIAARDPNLIFLIVFSLIFAFAVGITSYNFGALSRYKIPCLPFFGAFLMILLNYSKPASLAVRNQVNRFKKETALA